MTVSFPTLVQTTLSVGYLTLCNRNRRMFFYVKAQLIYRYFSYPMQTIVGVGYQTLSSSIGAGFPQIYCTSGLAYFVILNRALQWRGFHG